MSKSQTIWSNNSKNIDLWVTATRNTTIWNNESNFPSYYLYSDSTLTYTNASRTYSYISAVPTDQTNNKNPTTWTKGLENSTTWSNESLPQLGYTYDSTAVYDSTYTYDYTMFVQNQSNNKNVTAWAVVV